MASGLGSGVPIFGFRFGQGGGGSWQGQGGVVGMGEVWHPVCIWGPQA